MQASLRIETKQIEVIHPGIDVYSNFISERDKENVFKIIGSKKPIITTLARVEKRKGHEFVLNAIAEIKNQYPNLLYLIAGKGPYLEEIKNLSIKLKITENVKFLGWITEPEKSLILKNSDLFVMTPTTVGESVEGFGMAYIDAAFHGVAAIGTYSGGISDAIIHEETGLLCDEGDQIKITENIFKLLSNNHLRIKLGENGRKRAHAKYSWENKIDEYLSI